MREIFMIELLSNKIKKNDFAKNDNSYELYEVY